MQDEGNYGDGWVVFSYINVNVLSAAELTFKNSSNMVHFICVYY